MGRSRSPPAISVPVFRKRFEGLLEDCDGPGLHALLREAERIPAAARSPSSSSSASTDDVAAEVVRAGRLGVSEEGLEALCGALRLWIARYLAQQGPQGRWMLVPLLWLAGRPGRMAAELDRRGSTQKNQKKLVETMRDQFTKLQRDKRRREGALAVCCELLRLYFRLGQASQCSFLLAAVSQGQRGERLDLEALPKALAVTLCFLWGKHCVLDGSIEEAEEKLSWALANCPPQALANRRRILVYLVPCRLRAGRLPSAGLLKRHGLDDLGGFVKAVASGDVQLFNKELESREVQLIRAGTFLVIEKLKLLVFRNLCQQVHAVAARRIEAAGKAEHRHKQDLALYEQAFKWQDGCDADETLCLLAHLIYLGAIKGYLHVEQLRKIVFSKEDPFPDAAKWCPGA